MKLHGVTWVPIGYGIERECDVLPDQWALELEMAAGLAHVRAAAAIIAANAANPPGRIGYGLAAHPPGSIGYEWAAKIIRGRKFKMIRGGAA